MEMCCQCGGGQLIDGSDGGDDDSTPDEDDNTPDEDDTIPDVITSTCDTHESTDNGATDPFGDGCNEYAGNPEWCGQYDDNDFNSMEMCCQCGGGQLIDGSDGGDDDATPDEDDNTPDEDDIIPGVITPSCDTHESTDNGATDPYGDGCTDYAGNPEWCGQYDDNDFNSM